jgi:hypothetical protein
MKPFWIGMKSRDNYLGKQGKTKTLLDFKKSYDLL